MPNELHNGHRQRLKNRFLKSGIDVFEQHNILELLLFFAIPRMDTNDIAHNLMKRFGNIGEVFDAPYDELIKVQGVTSNAATLLKLVPNLSRVYLENKYQPLEVYDTPQKLSNYFIHKFVGVNQEQVYIMCLDSSCSFIQCDLLTQGTVTQANISIRKIVETVIRHNACSIVLAHNHPRGLAIPSNEDIITTVSIKNALKQLDVNLLDHIIIAQDTYVSLVEQGYISK
ncbi:DNA repair protein RadC [Paludicola sp. MB14-C6]|uniref:JAB domain-containing protein n=1 Tax=Paludihabitans sp. MB14-C6 TaxID=3070656 RepID=UPI0027DD38F9|nr:DNA repair protein RadC [Paludicola sp. MB14-C6]WMJ23402.1 DNA repair protein RadC [Paludicola sp. MB14-C6]